MGITSIICFSRIKHNCGESSLTLHYNCCINPDRTKAPHPRTVKYVISSDKKRRRKNPDILCPTLDSFFGKQYLNLSMLAYISVLPGLTCSVGLWSWIRASHLAACLKLALSWNRCCQTYFSSDKDTNIQVFKTTIHSLGCYCFSCSVSYLTFFISVNYKQYFCKNVKITFRGICVNSDGKSHYSSQNIILDSDIFVRLVYKKGDSAHLWL